METKCTAGGGISSVSLVACRGTWPWDRELGHDAEVVARPHAVYRLVEAKRRSQVVTSSVGPWLPQRAHERPRRTTADIPRVPFNSASRPGTPPTSGGPRPAREPGWRRPGTRGRPCPEARAARSADADELPEGSRGAARPHRTPAAHPCRAPDRPARGARARRAGPQPHRRRLVGLGSRPEPVSRAALPSAVPPSGSARETGWRAAS